MLLHTSRDHHCGAVSKIGGELFQLICCQQSGGHSFDADLAMSDAEFADGLARAG